MATTRHTGSNPRMGAGPWTHAAWWRVLDGEPVPEGCTVEMACYHGHEDYTTARQVIATGGDRLRIVRKGTAERVAVVEVLA